MTSAPARRILSTMFRQDPEMPEWERRVDSVTATGEAAIIRELISRGRHYDAVVLDGSLRRDQLAAALLSHLPHRPRIIITDATWKQEGGPLERWLNRAGIRAIDGPHVTYCVLTNLEVERLPETWGLRGQTRFVPWPYTLREPALSRPGGDNGRVFAGGNSLRDYDTLIAAAGAWDAPVDLATSTLTDAQRARLPANVVAGPLPQAEYDEALLGASIVVVPMHCRPDRSTGQTTYVNAMALGKPLVVTGCPWMTDYIEDGETGRLVPPGDADALAQAVGALLADPAKRRRLGENARREALAGMSLRHYADRVLAVVDEALS
jgi:hypothetical protein